MVAVLSGLSRAVPCRAFETMYRLHAVVLLQQCRNVDAHEPEIFTPAKGRGVDPTGRGRFRPDCTGSSGISGRCRLLIVRRLRQTPYGGVLLQQGAASRDTGQRALRNALSARARGRAYITHASICVRSDSSFRWAALSGCILCQPQPK